ncbi:methyltransferase domain-containing protein [Roseisolibacter sp. H3M3-2]|uniref:class I SAM-dependent methyltransferase n=1 Tax=Roseisolibacter sp. H3M3-2 TaxID=3031323 RepID=UPI0023DA075A|nr:methyltransferase domain-containing protein [Roseisolibacter sp. H3M3-2]MDF1502152.1 methyltransferase domain-containing protein [Roseisolibacter sp. H3M3-2]
MSALPHVSPAVLRLVQELVLGRWRAAGEELYREVGSLLQVEAGQEVLVCGCGDGTTCEWLAERTGAAVTGVDPDPDRIEEADERARELLDAGTPLPLSFQQAPLDDLPHETAVFDAVVGEPMLAAAADPERAVAELARVVKPMGAVVLLQLTWSSDISTAARGLLVERLGMRPQLLVEWKQMLRDAGVVDLQVQDWTDEAAEGASEGEAPQLTLSQKVQIVGRAFRRRGWRQALDALGREESLLRELSRERAVGFQVIRGVKWPHARGT